MTSDSFEGKEYLTAPEVARLMRVNRETVTKWLIEGKLTGVRIGNRWYITPNTVLPLLKGHE